jgi:putative lipoic acid-binding regulatory protein
MTIKDKSPLSFPCRFPIKAMGLAVADLETIVLNIVQQHAPDVDQTAMHKRPSANGKYLSVTVTIEATSREQLDAIYYDLTACEHVLMAL